MTWMPIVSKATAFSITSFLRFKYKSSALKNSKSRNFKPKNQIQLIKRHLHCFAPMSHSNQIAKMKKKIFKKKQDQ